MSQAVHSSTTSPPSTREIVTPETVTSLPVGAMVAISPVCVPRPVQRVATCLAVRDLLVDRDRAAREGDQILLEASPDARGSLDRLGLGRIVADVVGRDELVDHVQVAVPRLLEEPL